MAFPALVLALRLAHPDWQRPVRSGLRKLFDPEETVEWLDIDQPLSSYRLLQ